MTDEKRRFSRIPFKIKAEMAVNDVIYRVEELSNLSVGGCLFPITADLEAGTSCHVKILLIDTSSEMRIRIDAEIKRSDSRTVAVKFTRIDPDSLFHLQNIIRYNSPDADVVEKEFIEHPGII